MHWCTFPGKIFSFLSPDWSLRSLSLSLCKGKSHKNCGDEREKSLFEGNFTFYVLQSLILEPSLRSMWVNHNELSLLLVPIHWDQGQLISIINNLPKPQVIIFQGRANTFHWRKLVFNFTPSLSELVVDNWGCWLCILTVVMTLMATLDHTGDTCI